jgi:mannose-6-phosphate isomerase-like protein (cupin superfamily)
MTRLVEDPVLKQRLAFEPIDDGQAMRVEMWVDPGGGVPPHVHPRMEETFEVLSGELSLLDGRKWSVAKPGETVVVPAGKRHAYRNNGTVETHAICTARPPQSLEEFLTEAAAMAREGKLTRNGLPKTPGGAAQAARLAWRHRKMVLMRWI